jgi:hypothetical protein
VWRGVGRRAAGAGRARPAAQHGVDHGGAGDSWSSDSHVVSPADGTSGSALRRRSTWRQRVHRRAAARPGPARNRAPARVVRAGDPGVRRVAAGTPAGDEQLRLEASFVMAYRGSSSTSRAVISLAGAIARATKSSCRMRQRQWPAGVPAFRGCSRWGRRSGSAAAGWTAADAGDDGRVDRMGTMCNPASGCKD